MITYLKKLTEERDSLTASATSLTEKAAAEERDLTDTERQSMTAWQTRCAEIDSQLTEYGQQAESQRAYARLRESLSTPEEPERPSREPAVQTNSWGDLFVESAEFRSYHGSGSSQRVQVPWETRANLALADFPTALKTPYLHTVAPVSGVDAAVGRHPPDHRVVELGGVGEVGAQPGAGRLSGR